ncbi:MAG: hypothetical protein WD250_09475 [Egibacteraceae bacterium]
MTTATLTRTPAGPTARVARTVIIVRAEDGEPRVYVDTPIGWRLRAPAGRLDGELVIEPALIARLDLAAVAVQTRRGSGDAQATDRRRQAMDSGGAGSSPARPRAHDHG